MNNLSADTKILKLRDTYPSAIMVAVSFFVFCVSTELGWKVYILLWGITLIVLFVLYIPAIAKRFGSYIITIVIGYYLSIPYAILKPLFT